MAFKIYRGVVPARSGSMSAMSPTTVDGSSNCCGSVIHVIGNLDAATTGLVSGSSWTDRTAVHGAGRDERNEREVELQLIDV